MRPALLSSTITPTTEKSARRSYGIAVAAAIPALVLAAVQARWAWPFFSDDSFISLRYAQRLVEGHGLTWTAGERVEGYSNLLWVLSCAALGGLGIDLVTAARCLGGACTTLALVLLARAVRPHDARTAMLAGIAPLLLAATSPVMAWTLAGLEGPMVMLWLVWGGLSLLRLLRDEQSRTTALVKAGLPFALLCLTRPDGALWAATTGFGLVLGHLQHGLLGAVWRAVAFGALPAAAYLGQLAFRLAYYGDIVPNTAHVKVEFGAEVWSAGLDYVGLCTWVAIGSIAIATLGALCLLGQPRQRRMLAVLLGPACAWFVYLATVGGDHFPGFRLLQPALTPLTLLAAVAILSWSTTRLRTATAIGLGLLATGANLWQSRTVPLSTFVPTEIWEWRGKAIGELLHGAFAKARPLFAVDAAGALPFYSQLPALDMLGLCDRTIAQSPPPPFLAALGAANGRKLLQGHMRGNGRYVMDRQPDLMLYSEPPGLPLPVFVSALQFEDDPRFLDGYRCVVLDTGERELRPGQRERLRVPLWVRVEGRAGIQRSEHQIDVPAYLLGAYQQPRAFRFSYAPPAPTDPGFADWDRELRATFFWFTQDCNVFAVPSESGTFLWEMRRRGAARLQLQVPAGRWRVRLEPAVAGLQASLQGAIADPDGATFTVAEGAKTTLVVEARPEAALPLQLRTITLQSAR
ncbi:MAG: hypothetical protein IT456_06395 [Planctomycetes bacterium]|jgi:arabinofuranosyltransferase|nr:hypothetical protein [Planctomycetota bacterium]